MDYETNSEIDNEPKDFGISHSVGKLWCKVQIWFVAWFCMVWE
jgi:hypothetical protein